MEARLKVRMSMHDAHYGGNLVDGAKGVCMTLTMEGIWLMVQKC
jgi:hypothetical protein